MKEIEKTELEELIRLSRDKSDAAFSELVRRYTPMMRGVVSGFSSSPFDYNELFSEACVALHSAVNRYDLEQSEVTFGLYARICVYNRIVDLIRRDEANRSIVSSDVDLALEGDNAESGLLAREAFEKAMECAKSTLSDYEYRVFILHIQGYKTAAIAKMLSRNAKSVDNAKSRIFKRLREVLYKYHN